MDPLVALSVALNIVRLVLAVIRFVCRTCRKRPGVRSAIGRGARGPRGCKGAGRTFKRLKVR